MARIADKATATPAAGDLLLGTDVSAANATRNFTVASLALAMGGEFDVRQYGAAGDGVADDTVAIQAAIDAAAAAGVAGYLGGVVTLPPGVYQISSPLVLPRSGPTPTGVAWLVGANVRATVLRGTSAFPAGRALVEWADTAARTQHQRIENLTFSLPFVSGVRAIHYKLSGAVTTVAGVSEQWFSFGRFAHLVVEAQGDYASSSVIRMEGGCRWTDFVDVWGDPSAGSNSTAGMFDVRLLEFDHEVGSSGSDPAIGSDSVGFEFGGIVNPIATVRRGGFGLLFKGRMAFSSITGLGGNGPNVNGGRSGNGGVGVHVINGYRFTIDGLGNEGQGEAAQIRLEDCRYPTLRNVGLGTPDATDAQWAATTAYALNARVVPTTLKGSGVAARNAYYVCTTAGTSGGAEPAWPAAGTVADGTAVWTFGGAAVGNGLELVGTTDARIDGRWAVGGANAFSNRLVKVVTLDANSRRNVLERIDVNEAAAGAATSEFTVSAAAADLNVIQGYGVTGALGSEALRPYAIGAGELAGGGTPEGAVAAGVGSRYRRVDGGAGTSLYVKESGSGNTGWVAK